MIFQEIYFSNYIMLTVQMSLPNCLYFLRYWSTCVLQMFVNQVVTSQMLILTLSFKSSRFPTRPKSQDKNLNLLRLRARKAFDVK